MLSRWNWIEAVKSVIYITRLTCLMWTHLEVNAALQEIVPSVTSQKCVHKNTSKLRLLFYSIGVFWVFLCYILFLVLLVFIYYFCFNSVFLNVSILYFVLIQSVLFFKCFYIIFYEIYVTILVCMLPKLLGSVDFPYIIPWIGISIIVTKWSKKKPADVLFFTFLGNVELFTSVVGCVKYRCESRQLSVFESL